MKGPIQCVWKTYLLNSVAVVLYASIAASTQEMIPWRTTESRIIYQPENREIILLGPIRPGAQKIINDYAQKSKSIYTLFVSSPGGDLDTAIAIGRIARRDRVLVWVPNGWCLSSCVFILAGGASRGVMEGADIGIHRPFFPLDTATSPAQQKLQYQEMERKVKAYLREVNIPTELFDYMLRVRPGEMKMLTGDELERFGLTKVDPDEDAARTASEAKSYGITVEELLRRQARVKAECPYYDFNLPEPVLKKQIEEYVDCEWPIMNGLTVEEYMRRKARAKAECQDGDHKCEHRIMTAH